MINSNFTDVSSMSSVKAKVELYNGSAEPITCTCSDVLEDFKVSRQGDTTKFFGFGVCQKLDFSLIDLNRQLTVTPEMSVKIYLGDGTTFDVPYPTFYIKEVKRNEKTNIITCTAYDGLYNASECTWNQISPEQEFHLQTISDKIAVKLGLSASCRFDIDSAAVMQYPDTKLEGTETLREILDDVAEVTTSIYYLNNEDRICFKTVKHISPIDALHISKKVYYDLETYGNKVLTGISKTTELGNNLSTGDDTGSIQYIRDNVFWENTQDDIVAGELNRALTYLENLYIPQYKCDWNGDWRLELGDYVEIVQYDFTSIYSFVLNDTHTYKGYFSAVTEWQCTGSDNEGLSNPTTLGDKINQTFARVDKVNQRIDLVATEVSDNTSKVSQIELDLDSINLTLEQHQEQINAVGDVDFTEINEKISAIEQEMDSITLSVSEVDTKISNSAEDVKDYTTAQINTEIKKAIEQTEEADAEVLNQSKSFTTQQVSVALGEAEDLTNAQINTVNNKISTIQTDLDAIELTVQTNTETIISNKEETDESITAVNTKLGQLEVKDSQILASVQSLESVTVESNENTNKRIDSLAKETALKVDAEGVEIIIEETLSEGVEKVVTSSKKYTFDDEGLNISSNSSNISTTITEDGMRIYRHSSEVLTANNEGVKAEDLHATTFLIIGNTSRLEDRGNRTTCFWIGD